MNKLRYILAATVVGLAVKSAWENRLQVAETLGGALEAFRTGRISYLNGQERDDFLRSIDRNYRDEPLYV